MERVGHKHFLYNLSRTGRSYFHVSHLWAIDFHFPFSQYRNTLGHTNGRFRFRKLRISFGSGTRLLRLPPFVPVQCKRKFMEGFMFREILLLAAVLAFASAMPAFADTFTSTLNFGNLNSIS